MIKFNWVEAKNFLTVGDVPIRVLLDKSPTTGIHGKNGAGKSSLIIETLSYCLFGKSYRGLTKPMMVNTTNKKGAVVSMQFTKNDSVYVVTRSIKPDAFTITKNDVPMAETGIRDFQGELDAILQFDFGAFVRTSLLGEVNYKPFFEMTIPQRREFVEAMLGVSVFTDMNKVVKPMAVANIADFNDIERRIATNQTILGEKIESNARAEKSNDAQVEEIREEIRAIIAEVTNNKVKLAALRASLDQDAYDALVEEKLTLQNRIYAVIGPSIVVANSEKKAANDLITFYLGNTICPTCDTVMEDAHRTMHIDSQREIIRIRTMNIQDANSEMALLHEKIAELSDSIAEYVTIENSMKSYDNKIKSLMDNATFLKRRMDAANKTYAMIDVSPIEEEIGNLEIVLEELRIKREEYSFALELLKDTGIKATVIENYIPMLNSLTNKYLKVMDFGVSVSFDSEFNETITGRYADEFSYKSLSRGESTRMSLATLFAWRDIAAMATGAATNLLVLDEVGGSSLDMDGIDALFSILGEFGEDQNTFIVSHRPEVIERCYSSMKIEKINGFAKISM